MVSFFRRKKPATAPSERRYSTEELAAAFPDAPPVASPAVIEPEPAADKATTVAPPAPAVTGHLVAEHLGVEPAVTAPALVEPTHAAPAAVEPAASTEKPTLPAEARAAAPVARHVAVVAPAPIPTPEPKPEPVIAPIPAPAEDLSASTPAPTPPVAASIDKPAALPGKMGWRERLRGTAFARSFGGLFHGNPKLDDALLDEIETALIIADVGVTATADLVEDLRKRMKAREFADANALLKALRADLIALLAPVALPLHIDPDAKPFVILTVGVNGVGKTTTIGKLARRLKGEGRSLMLAAGDTFRAAAVAQLQSWGERNGVPVIAQGQNADAASVAFDALQAAKARGTQVLIADTAGRLHTQQGLMAELGKIKRVIRKLDDNAPHEVLMVIDGTTGQNALSQLRQFHAAVEVTGLVVTKLDGTAKGGVVFALAREFGIPIRFAGIGERPEDLRVFDAEAFVDALLPETLGA
ncbi:MAG TPA: signal recognition particle-docking protein FtsY [Lysobacter sp.]|nr:signal recognition particle-docking protein FtsY [Lysobacter sp.]